MTVPSDRKEPCPQCDGAPDFVQADCNTCKGYGYLNAMPAVPSDRKERVTFLLMSEFERLEEWCRCVRAVFDGQVPYLVGSCRTTPDYRDVDVRVMLNDDEFDARWTDLVKVRMVNRAVSIWGQQETGLPIDFQVQRMTEANADYGGEQRNPMGGRVWSKIPTSGVPAVSRVGVPPEGEK